MSLNKFKMVTNTQIRKWNEEFKNATPSEKRILIAKDVLAMLKAKKITANAGSYIRDIDTDLDWEDSAQRHINKLNCSCCAMGACLISTVKYKNTLTIWELNNADAGSKEFNLLKGIFSPKQLLLIEYAFEGLENGVRVGKENFGACISSKKFDKCEKFYYKYNSSDERLKAIMTNIIKNKGLFILN